MPQSVVERARVVLDALEKGEREGKAQPKALIDDLPLFSAVAAAPAPVPVQASPVDDMLADIHPDNLSPKEALDLVYRLKDALQSE